jgi:flagellar basal-body rod modification protein FlgD
MDVSAIIAPIAAQSSSSGKGTTNLSTTDFYKLLAAQIQYQNPFDDSSSSGGGSSSTGYLTDLAIMSATSAVKEMTNVENYSMSAAMAGKKVTYKSSSTALNGEVTTTQKYGTVSAVDFTGEKPRLYITSEKDGKTAGEWIQYDTVEEIYSNDVTLPSNSQESQQA